MADTKKSKDNGPDVTGTDAGSPPDSTDPFAAGLNEEDPLADLNLEEVNTEEVNTEEVNTEEVNSPKPQDPKETQDIRFIPDFVPEDPDADDRL